MHREQLPLRVITARSQEPRTRLDYSHSNLPIKIGTLRGNEKDDNDKKKVGGTGDRTLILGAKTPCTSHYTIPPLHCVGIWMYLIHSLIGNVIISVSLTRLGNSMYNQTKAMLTKTTNN